MRLERERNRRHLAVLRIFAHEIKDDSVAAVHAVEISYGDDGSREGTTRTLETSNDPQRQSEAGGTQPPICWRRREASEASGVPG